jgi:hypothetical protein
MIWDIYPINSLWFWCLYAWHFKMILITSWTKEAAGYIEGDSMG